MAREYREPSQEGKAGSWDRTLCVLRSHSDARGEVPQWRLRGASAGIRLARELDRQMQLENNPKRTAEVFRLKFPLAAMLGEVCRGTFLRSKFWSSVPNHRSNRRFPSGTRVRLSKGIREFRELHPGKRQHVIPVTWFDALDLIRLGYGTTSNYRPCQRQDATFLNQLSRPIIRSLQLPKRLVQSACIFVNVKEEPTLNAQAFLPNNTIISENPPFGILDASFIEARGTKEEGYKVTPFYCGDREKLTMGEKAINLLGESLGVLWNRVPSVLVLVG